jgi:hypothetical protein
MMDEYAGWIKDDPHSLQLLADRLGKLSNHFYELAKEARLAKKQRAAK